MNEVLSKDVIEIVHRYLVDYWYLQVRKQYRDVWLNANSIFWNDLQNLFQTNCTFVANWRHKGDVRTTARINRFHCGFFGFLTSLVYLPINYM